MVKPLCRRRPISTHEPHAVARDVAGTREKGERERELRERERAERERERERERGPERGG
jgi:hypothetical protein